MKRIIIISSLCLLQTFISSPVSNAGGSCSTIGNKSYCSDGSSSTTIGGKTYNSDGSSSTKLGGKTYCSGMNCTTNQKKKYK